MLSKETSPPPRYSQGSIIKEMEKHGLGTKTTRASILQTLYDRGYIQGKSIGVTALGMKVADTLGKYSPELVSEKLTRSFEKEMELVEKGKKKRENIIKHAKKVLTKIAKELKANEIKIGRDLEKGILETKEEQSYLGACAVCDNGDLKVMFNPMTKKRFVGCSSYFFCIKCGFSKTACKCKCSKCGKPKGKCKCDWKEKKWTPKCTTGYPLPLKGMINNTGAICEKCRTPIIQVWRKGKRPFRMCLDPLCETKKEWKKPEKGTVDVKKIHKKMMKKSTSTKSRKKRN
jgi:DNA topoisomerase-1